MPNWSGLAWSAGRGIIAALRRADDIRCAGQGFPASVTFLQAGLETWNCRLKTANLAEGFFRNVRRFLGRFPDFLSAEHCDRALGLYLLGAEMN
jgi:hypothetical protein